MIDFSLIVTRLLKYDEEYKLLYSMYNSNPFPYMTLSIDTQHILTEKNIGRFRKWFHNDKPLVPLTVYEPFYPENFYSWWEVLLNVKFNDQEICCVDYGQVYKHYKCSPLGGLEAMLKLKEYHNLNVTISRKSNKKIINYYADQKFNKTYIFDIIEFNTFKQEQEWINTKRLYLVDHNNSIPEMVIGCNLILVKNMFEITDKLLETLSCFRSVEIKKPKVDHVLEPNLFFICETFLGETKQEDILNELTDKVKHFRYDYGDYAHQYMQLMVGHKRKAKNIKTDFNTDNIIQWVKDHQLLLVSELNPRKFGKKNFIRGPLSMQLYNNKLFRSNNLQEIKTKLNQYKRTIDTKVQGRNITEYTNWDTITDDVDLLHHLKTKLKDKYEFENVTNAWMKCFEVVSSFGLLRKKFTKAFHICESPGAFIVACQKWMYLNHDQGLKAYHWYAQSLNPIRYNQRIHVFKDQLGIIKRYLKRWLWGRTKTGDITNWKNIMGYKKDRYLKNITFITADGGLHMAENMFNEQEAYTGKLIIGEVATFLNVLKKNGSGFIKMYLPFAEPYMISLLYLLTTMFRETHLFKPLTSHPSSSEVYVVCIGYEKLLTQELNDMFKNKLETWEDNVSHKQYLIPFETISKEFISSLSRASNFLAERQKKSIERSLYYYSHPEEIKDEMEKNQNDCEDLWLKRYLKDIKVKKIDESIATT